MNIIKNIIKKYSHNKYDFIVPLGYNCEVAFRFWQVYKFVDSSLFAWTYSHSIKDLIYALNNYNDILTGEISLPKPLYECQNTHILFHGKENMQEWINNNYNLELIEKDKKELRSRISYLKEKLLKIFESDASKLFIYKISQNDIINTEINNYIEELYSFLEKNTKNFKLLIVTEEKYKSNINIHKENLILKTVKKYSSDNAVTNKNEGDFKSWKRIYKEYRPSKIKIIHKKFKFEDI